MYVGQKFITTEYAEPQLEEGVTVTLVEIERDGVSLYRDPNGKRYFLDDLEDVKPLRATSFIQVAVGEQFMYNGTECLKIRQIRLDGKVIYNAVILETGEPILVDLHEEFHDKRVGKYYRVANHNIFHNFHIGEIVTLEQIDGKMSLYANEDGKTQWLCDVDHDTPTIEEI